MSIESARVLAAAADIARDWDAVEAQCARAQDVDAAASAPNAAYVAVALDHAYQAFESLLVRVERMLDLPARTGERWHAEILRDACLPIDGLRPALVPQEAQRAWQHILAFRHFFRHAYRVELEPAKLATNAAHLEAAIEICRPSIAALIDALRAG